MPVGNDIFSFLDTLNVAFGVKAFIVLFLVFYTVFALILFRQVQLMSRTLPTALSPFLLFLAILHMFQISVSIPRVFLRT